MTACTRRTPAPAQASAQPQLRVAPIALRAQISARIELGQGLLRRGQDLATAGWGIGESDAKDFRSEYYSWNEYNVDLLKQSFDQEGPARDYAGTAFGSSARSAQEIVAETCDDIKGEIRRLSSQSDRLDLYKVRPGIATAAPEPLVGEDVFVVHGHDGEAKQAVARFLLKLTGRDPVILHEQPNRGRTIIEKFEAHGVRAAAAVVLMTGDDVGSAVGGDLRPRARQNVVWESAWFSAKLGRERVVILYEPGVELPSDLSGVLYIEMDPAGAWRAAVARELKAVHIPVNTEALLAV